MAAVEHFQCIGLLVGRFGFPSDLLTSQHRCLDFEVDRGRLWNMLTLFLEILTKTNFEDKI